MIFLIRFYQFIKPLRTAFYTSVGIPAHSCRRHPTCSQYTKTAIAKYGTIQGLLLGAKRFLTCNPLSSSAQ